MKEVVKEHPFRPIILNFDMRKKPHPAEIEALDAYYRMHDEAWEWHEEIGRRRDALTDIHNRQMEMEKTLATIELDVSFLEYTEGLRDHKDLPPREPAFSIEIQAFRDAVRQHNTDLIALNQKIRDEIKLSNDYSEYIYEYENKISFEGLERLRDIYRHWRHVRVDIMSLDRDEEEFKDVYKQLQREQYDYFDYTSYISESYIAFQEHCESVYLRAQRVNDLIVARFDNEAN